MYPFVDFILVFLCGFLGSGLGYLFFYWSHLRHSLGLEYRLSDLEGRVTREVKIRAAESHQKRKNADLDLLEQIKEQPAKPELNLSSWIQNAYKR